MSYIDNFLIPISKENIDSYKEIELIAGEVWLDNGALAYKACVADDIDSKGAQGTFRSAASVSESETVVFGFILFKSKSHRDEVNQKARKDPRVKSICNQINRPFEANRIIFGGFEVMVDM
jgi:uncharacterized protein YbaA (DUF1428 family)